jgi:CDP-paratose 2-epimerase
MDFSINATGTLVMLEACRRFCPDAVFVFISTNKVYGDSPNRLPFVEQQTRWELDRSHPFFTGIDETMSIDQTMHSVFGAGKVAADIMVQEYGRYFGLKTGVFRGGCLTGPAHSGAELHGFLAWLVKCTLCGNPYTIYGYKGKQVRDNIHSSDLVNAVWHYFQNPRAGEVYNMGGSRHVNCSMIEAIALIEEITGKRLLFSVSPEPRKGDHIWWITEVSRFQQHYPKWTFEYDLRRILNEIAASLRERLKDSAIV